MNGEMKEMILRKFQEYEFVRGNHLNMPIVSFNYYFQISIIN